MFKTESIEKLIRYALLSGFIEGDVPVSMMLISPPESAKTSILRSIECVGALETMDLSPKPIVDSLIPRIKSEKIHHLIVPDLVKILSHKTTTIDSTIAFLNALMEEGVKRSMFYGQMFESETPICAGIITSVTPEFFAKYFKRWNDIGFITRFIPISYTYSGETIAMIHRLIREDKLLYKQPAQSVTKNIKRKIKNGTKFKIGIEENASAMIEVQAQTIAKKISEYKVATFVQGGRIHWVRPNIAGFRLQRQLRMLAKAIALSKSKKMAEMTDVSELVGLLEYIGYPNAPKVV